MTLSTHAIAQRGSSTDSIWNDESSSTTQSVSLTVSRRSSMVAPMLPPRWTRSPARSRMAATSAVVVVFPLVPVIPQMRARQRSKTRSISLRTGTPWDRATSSSGASHGTPGLGHTISASAATSSG